MFLFSLFFVFHRRKKDWFGTTWRWVNDDRFSLLGELFFKCQSFFNSSCTVSLLTKRVYKRGTWTTFTFMHLSDAFIQSDFIPYSAFRLYICCQYMNYNSLAHIETISSSGSEHTVLTVDHLLFCTQDCWILCMDNIHTLIWPFQSPQGLGFVKIIIWNLLWIFHHLWILCLLLKEC